MVHKCPIFGMEAEHGHLTLSIRLQHGHSTPAFTWFLSTLVPYSFKSSQQLGSHIHSNPWVSIRYRNRQNGFGKQMTAKTFVGFGATNTCSLLFEVLLSSLLAFSPFAFLFTFVGPFLLKPLALLACAFSMFSFGSKTLSILQTCCRCLCLDLGSSGSVVRICWFVAPFGHVLSTRETAKNVQKDFGAHIAWPLIAVSSLAWLNVLLAGLLFSPASCLASSQAISVGCFLRLFWGQRKHKSLAALQGVLGLRLFA